MRKNETLARMTEESPDRWPAPAWTPWQGNKTRTKIQTLDEYYYRRAIWLLLPNTKRNIYVEDLEVDIEDFADFCQCRGRWEYSDEIGVNGVPRGRLGEIRMKAFSLTFPDTTARRLMQKS